MSDLDIILKAVNVLGGCVLKLGIEKAAYDDSSVVTEWHVFDNRHQNIEDDVGEKSVKLANGQVYKLKQAIRLFITPWVHERYPYWGADNGGWGSIIFHLYNGQVDISLHDYVEMSEIYRLETLPCTS